MEIYGYQYQSVEAFIEHLAEVARAQFEDVHLVLWLVGAAVIFVAVMVRLIRRKKLKTVDRFDYCFTKAIVAFTCLWWMFILVDITLLQRDESEIRVALSLFNAESWLTDDGWIHERRLLSFFSNMLLFVPLGYLLQKLTDGRFRFISFGVCVSLAGCIELMQCSLSLGSVSLDEILARLLGAILGMGLLVLVQRKKRDKRSLQTE